MPKTGLQALRYSGPATGLNNNNATDYALTPGAATFTNNAGTAFTLVAQAANPTRLRNIATRAHVQTGENVLIAGFVIKGMGSKKVIVRGLGPSLTNFGIQGVLADPVLELHTPGGSVVTNDNWKSTKQAEIQATGLAPTNDKESAIVATLTAGNYTTILRGRNNTSGVGLVEAYDLNPNRYRNSSTSAVAVVWKRARMFDRRYCPHSNRVVRGEVALTRDWTVAGCFRHSPSLA